MKIEREPDMKMLRELQKRLCGWCKTILSFIVKMAKKMSLPFVAFANGMRAKAQQSKYYDKIEDISLYNFAKCCEGELQYICKKHNGKRNHYDEIKAFESISIAFNDALNVDIKSYHADIRYYILLSRLCILDSVLGTDITAREKEVLKGFGLRLTDKYDVNMCLIRGKMSQFSRELQELKEIINKKEKERKIGNTYGNFQKVLTAISTYYKLYLDIKKISVYEYCVYYNQYNEEIKQLEKQRRNGKRKN